LKRMAAVSLGMVLLLAGALRASLQDAKAEPNLEKRSKLALENAEQALTEARAAYAKGDNTQVEARAAEIRESVELAETSLHQTGKNPRKSPRWFKHAEIVTRDLLRRLDTFQQEMNAADRPMLDGVKGGVQQAHDNLLLGIMGGKEK
jgi:hypothetical protein